METATSQPSSENSPQPKGAGLLGRNPVALKELRGRMRGPRAFIVLTAFVSLMSLFAVALYGIYQLSVTNGATATGGVVGKMVFGAIVATELFLVSFVAPAFTAGAISGERERQTFDLLRTTLLPAHRIVWGKLLSAMAYITLLMVAGIPLQGIAFLLGGVTFEELLLANWLLLVSATGFSAAGIFFSARTGRTLNATVFTYTFAILGTVVLPIVALVLTTILTPLTYGLGSTAALEIILLYAINILASASPIGAAVMTEVLLLNSGSVLISNQTLSNGVSIPLLSPWIIFTVIALGTSGLLLRASMRIVARAEE